MKRLYHFLGSVYFTCTLLPTVALFVIAGTILESKTDSHAYAATLTYGNPLFCVLLWLIFINILFAALRRYPFKKRHIPFLITHFGLLMILGGVIAKYTFGLQGTMTLMEGTKSQTVTLSNTSTLHIQSKEKKTHDFTLLNKTPHVEETLETWFKGDLAVINGIPPFPITSTPIKSSLKMPGSHEPYWDLYAFRSEKDYLEELYFSEATIRLTDRQTDTLIAELPLAKTLNLPGEQLTVSFTPEALTIGDITLPLQGEEALLSHSPIAIDIIRKPALIFTQKKPPDVTLHAIDAHGQIYTEHFSKDTLQSYLVYDEGFGGTHIQTSIPFAPFPFGRCEREEKHLVQIGTQLKDSDAPPLTLFKKSCQIHDLDFSTIFPTFLKEWADCFSPLYPQENTLTAPLSTIMQTLPWEMFPEQEQKGCYWTAHLLDTLKSDQDILSQLKEKEWPLLPILESVAEPLTALAQQIFFIADQLPLPPKPKTPEQNARLFSAFLRAYGIHLDSFAPHIPAESFTLETPLTFKYTPIPPSKKLEDNRPAQTLLYKNTPLTLAFNGPKIPTPDGQYLLSYGPEKKKIPHTLYLHDARQINHPNTNQPLSFESAIQVDGEEVTLSMNRVFETKRGYRIYLANITPAEETAIQKVQLIINYDPAKYWLTYPGGAIVSLGILLLARRGTRTQKK